MSHDQSYCRPSQAEVLIDKNHALNAIRPGRNIQSSSQQMLKIYDKKPCRTSGPRTQ